MVLPSRDRPDEALVSQVDLLPTSTKLGLAHFQMEVDLVELGAFGVGDYRSVGHAVPVTPDAAVIGRCFMSP